MGDRGRGGGGLRKLPRNSLVEMKKCSLFSQSQQNSGGIQEYLREATDLFDGHVESEEV